MAHYADEQKPDKNQRNKRSAKQNRSTLKKCKLQEVQLGPPRRGTCSPQNSRRELPQLWDYFSPFISPLSYVQSCLLEQFSDDLFLVFLSFNFIWNVVEPLKITDSNIFYFNYIIQMQPVDSWKWAEHSVQIKTLNCSKVIPNVYTCASLF